MYSGMINGDKGVSERIRVAAQQADDAVRMVFKQLEQDLKEMDRVAREKKHDTNILETRQKLQLVRNKLARGDIAGAKALMQQIIDSPQFNHLPQELQNRLRERGSQIDALGMGGQKKTSNKIDNINNGIDDDLLANSSVNGGVNCLR